MSPDISDYEDAMDRIMSADVPPDATGRGEVARALSESGPQVTLEVANNVANAVLTEEQVREALDGQGSLPSEGLVDSASQGLSDYSDESRRQRVAEEVKNAIVLERDIDEAINRDRSRLPSESEIEQDIAEATSGKDWIGQDRSARIDRATANTVTLEDVADRLNQPRDSLPTESEIQDEVRRAVSGKRLPGVSESQIADQVRDEIVTEEEVLDDLDQSAGPVFREDVEGAIESQSGELGGTTVETATDEIAGELGAPSEQEYNRARSEALTSGGEVTPAERDDIDSTATGRVSTIESSSGETIGVLGDGPTEQAVADAEGVDTVSLEEANEAVSLDQSSGRATITFDGEEINEVDL